MTEFIEGRAENHIISNSLHASISHPCENVPTLLRALNLRLPQKVGSALNPGSALGPIRTRALHEQLRQGHPSRGLVKPRGQGLGCGAGFNPAWKM